jgi:hypothetical protein
MPIAGLPYWGHVAAFFVTVWGTFTLTEGMDAAWGRVSDRVWAAVERHGGLATAGGIILLVAGVIACLWVSFWLSVAPVFNTLAIYDEWVRGSVEWRWAIVSTVLFAGPWLGVMLVVAFLADPSAPARRYLAAFKALLAAGGVAGAATVVPGAVEGSPTSTMWLYALATLLLAGLGIFLGRARLSGGWGGGPPGTAAPARGLWRNKGFLLACAIAAWLGIEAAGKGMGLLKWLLPRG